MREFVLLGCVAFLSGAAAAPRTASSVVIFIGPAGADTAKRTAEGVASAAHRVLSVPGSSVELRRAGSTEAVAFEPGVPVKEIEAAVARAAAEAGDAAPAVVLASLEAAAQSMARRKGNRILIAAAENQPLAKDEAKTLEQVIEFCRDHAIRVLVLDQWRGGGKEADPPLRKLAEASGGTLIRSPKSIDSSLAQMSVKPSTGQEAGGEAAAAPVNASLPAMPTELPVRTRFVRLSPMRVQSWGTARAHSSGGGPSGGGIITREGGTNMEGATGPTQGVLLVEAPLSGFHFEVDDNSGTYLARGRLTQVVRDAGGRDAWRASKEMVIKGPLDKLKGRRAGNIYYMRTVTLPGGQYTLEATVEDLLAGKKGGVREPLQTGTGLPGFNVSDAVFVRPFKPATDKFEADAILSYDGEALSPLLSPRFDANTTANFQVYFIIYPDLQGAKPEVSLEILQRGRVAGRVPIPFTDSLKDTALEGIGAMRGEQKHEFPFLATIRGAKLTPGDYEARVIVRQGRNVLSRSAPFRVEGEAAPAALIPRAPAGGDAAPAAEGGEEELENIVLPEVDPVELRGVDSGLSAEELAKAWEETALLVRDYSDRLPNFRCKQLTRRLTAPVKSPQELKERDVFVHELTYEDGKESYRTVEVNGLKTNRERRAADGVSSSGEFGSLLRGLFNPKVDAKYKWAGRAMTGGALCRVFDVEVAAERSNFVLTHNLEQEAAGYRGRIFIDEESGFVRRVTITGEAESKKLALQAPTLSLDYGLVQLGGQDYLVPLRSVLQVRQGKTIVRNESLFRDYHKFEASSSIRFEPGDPE